MSETSHNQARIIGEKLRAIRQEKKMSLRELASSAEISASMLSQIETGKSYPSVRSIYSIAAALDVSVDYFFPDQTLDHHAENHADGLTSGELTASEMREAQLGRFPDATNKFVIPTRSPEPVTIVHADARPTIELKGGVTWARLTALAEDDAEFLEVTYAPGASSGAKMSYHEGREFGIVMEGELVIELGFDVYTLLSGDSIIFDSNTPHRLSNRTTDPVRALWVILK